MTMQEIKNNKIKTYYKIVDLYDGLDVLGRVLTLKEARKLAQEQYNETDSECYVLIIKYNYNETKNKYIKINDNYTY